MDSGRGRRPTSAEILVVEDDDLVASAFTCLLGPLARIAVSGTLAEAERALPRSRFAGVVLDVQLPDGSGLALLEAMRRQLLPTPVLVVSGRFDRTLAARCHALDAECVFKPDVSDDLLLFAERAIARHETAEARTTTTIDALRGELRLTPRETDFVRLVARGDRHHALASRAGVSLNTMKTMVRRLLEKFQEPTLEAVARSVLEETLRSDASGRGPKR